MMEMAVWRDAKDWAGSFSSTALRTALIRVFTWDFTDTLRTLFFSDWRFRLIADLWLAKDFLPHES